MKLIENLLRASFTDWFHPETANSFNKKQTQNNFYGPVYFIDKKGKRKNKIISSLKDNSQLVD